MHVGTSFGADIVHLLQGIVFVCLFHPIKPKTLVVLCTYLHVYIYIYKPCMHGACKKGKNDVALPSNECSEMDVASQEHIMAA